MKRWIIVLGLIFMAVLVTAMPAYAISLPSSTPTVIKFNVYRNLLETGDWLILIYSNKPYVTIPDEPVWQAFTWRMIDTDGTTELGSCLEPPYNDNGYGYNLGSMYFNSVNATSIGLIWGEAYIMRLSGNPAVFTSPPEYNFNLSSADYTPLTNSDDIKAELATRILQIATDLDTRWGLGATYSLLFETETGTTLSFYGEAFFRSAIYGLQGLCPQVFAYVVKDIDLTERTWAATYIAILQNQYAGTWVDTAKNAGKALFGTADDFTSLLISILSALVVFIVSVILSGDAWHGFADARTQIIALTRLGFFNLGFLGLLAALAVIYTSSRLWKVFT